MIIEAIDDSICEYRHKAKLWEGRGRDVYFNEEAVKLTALQQQLQKVEEAWLR